MAEIALPLMLLATRMTGTRNPALLLLAAVSALTGGVFWSVKGLAILIADSQPDYVFELGLSCFGIASLGIAGRVTSTRSAALSVIVLACLATGAGIASAVTYVVAGDNVAFSVFAAAAGLATLTVLLYGGHMLRAWSALPFYLGCLYVLSLPVGGVLAVVDERLLEIPLLIVAVGWIALAARMASDTHLGGLTVEPPASTG